MNNQFKWWQAAVFYQVYPRSFADGNGDGIGDFQGITQKLDYLQDLGIDAIWLSPHFPSPQFDCGYDITNFTGIAPEYGTMEDFIIFLHEAHRRGLRVVLDLVLNHTSHEHPWFQESRASQINPRRDWYIWHPGKLDHTGLRVPPNNWISTFDGRAWEFDEQTQEYYYHFFLKQQPDLNWRNPAVKQAMWEVVRYWLDLGVDGYRLDAIGAIFEHPSLPDHPLDLTLAEMRRLFRNAKSPEEREQALELEELIHSHQLQQNGMHELMQELRSLVDEYDDCVLIAEDEDISYHGNGDNELHMVFNFPLMRTKRLTPEWVLANQNSRLKQLAEISPFVWPCNTLGNHDSSRVFSHFSDGIHGDKLARLSLALMLTLRGTPFLYYGEEIGMTDLALDKITQFKDFYGIWQYHAEIQEFGTTPEDALIIATELTRDRCRTPMQWKDAPNAGFSPDGAETWLPVNKNYSTGINVESQSQEPGSMLKFYQELLRVRGESSALIKGTYAPWHKGDTDYLAFVRETREQRCLVILNFSDTSHRIQLDPSDQIKRVLFRNGYHSEFDAYGETILLHAHDIFIAEIDKKVQTKNEK